MQSDPLLNFLVQGYKYGAPNENRTHYQWSASQARKPLHSVKCQHIYKICWNKTFALFLSKYSIYIHLTITFSGLRFIIKLN